MELRPGSKHSAVVVVVAAAAAAAAAGQGLLLCWSWLMRWSWRKSIVIARQRLVSGID
jgi:hypothetical protein